MIMCVYLSKVMFHNKIYVIVDFKNLKKISKQIFKKLQKKQEEEEVTENNNKHKLASLQF